MCAMPRMVPHGLLEHPDQPISAVRDELPYMDTDIARGLVSCPHIARHMENVWNQQKRSKMMQNCNPIGLENHFSSWTSNFNPWSQYQVKMVNMVKTLSCAIDICWHVLISLHDPEVMLTLENFGFFCQEFGLWDPAVEAAPSFLDFDQEVCCVEGPVPDRVYQGGSTHSVRWVISCHTFIST